MKIAINAIDKESHQKLILVTGIGAGDSQGHGSFFYDRLLNPLLRMAIDQTFGDIHHKWLRISPIESQLLRTIPAQTTNAAQAGNIAHILHQN